MACSSCRKAPVWRTPTLGTVSGSTVNIIPNPARAGRPQTPVSEANRRRITGLKYAPK